MDNTKEPVIFIDTSDNFHPYECGQNCIHCRQEKTEYHDPKTCALCNFE
jgi:hypothetical protein